MKFKEELKKIVKETNPKVLHGKLKKIKKEKFIEITKFLSNNATIGQRVYFIINELVDVPNCPYCKNKKEWRDKREYSLAGYLKTCKSQICKDKYHKEFNSPHLNVKKKYGVDNISQTKEWRDKVKQTNLRKRGVEWNTQSVEFIKARQQAEKENGKEIQKKREKTNNKLYGVNHSLQRKDVRKKIEETNLKKYGVKVPTQSAKILDKVKQTNKEKYGGWYLSTADAKQKSQNFYLKNYGVTHNSKLASVIKKRYKKKKYIFPSGNEVFIQGNEGLALDVLLKNYKEKDLITDDIQMEKHIGKIKYFTEDKKEHRYYPDIYIKSINKIVEVKSNYTYNYAKEINELKKQACIDANFDFEFMIIK